MLGLTVFALLVIFGLPIASLLTARGTRDRLQRLELKFADLERQLAKTQTDVPAEDTTATEPDTPAVAPDAMPSEEAAAAHVVEPEPDEPEPTAETAPPGIAAGPKPHPASIVPAVSLEERLGTQWVVWAGGIALTLGGFFLVRYSIEQGWFGPGARIALAALVATILVVVGEWLRRSEHETGLAGIPSAHIPSVLTAAGTAIAYADIYAAYALYGFLNSATAFVLLGVVALATLAAALVHGRALAGLGLIGAYLTPLIVSSETPNYWALYLFLAVVATAAFSMARIRHWRWLAVTAVAANVLWALPGIGDVAAVAPHAFHLTAGFILTALLIVSGFLFGPDGNRGEIDPVSTGALGAYLLVASLLVLATGHDNLALLVFVGGVAASIGIAWRTDAALGAVPVSAFFVVLIFAQWAFNFDPHQIQILSGIAPDAAWRPDEFLFGAPLTLGGLLAALFGASGFLAQRRSKTPLVSVLWSACAVATPILILVALYYRIEGFDRSLPFATVALGLAGVLATATEALTKRTGYAGRSTSVAIFATGTIAALALALSLALEKGWLTIALATMVPGITWVARQRPWSVLRWLAAGMTIVVLGRIGWDPHIVGAAVGTTPIFNWLLYGYGIPAVAFGLAGWQLRMRTDDVPARIVDAAAVLFTVLLIVFEVRHYVSGGSSHRDYELLSEIALNVALLLAVVIGLERIALKSGSLVHDWGAQLLAGVVLLLVVFGLGIAANPLFTSEPVGGPFFNLVLLGYGLPAFLAAALAHMTRDTRPLWYSTIAAVAALALALGYLSLEIRTLFHGPILTAGAVTNAEQYTYSAVWLVFGVALLVAGVFTKSTALRAASALVIMLTVFKVFLFDMSGLTGIYRALSFLGLGAVLIGIGWFYQRLMFPKPASSPKAASEPNQDQG